jgi:hypothetical protein
LAEMGEAARKRATEESSWSDRGARMAELDREVWSRWVS